MKNKIYDLLMECNIDELLLTYKKYSNSFSLEDFYDYILKPIMYQIGYLWETGKIDITTEHAITNTANKLIKLITPNVDYENNYSTNFKRVAILTVDGELHNTACNIIESLLINLKFFVYNLSPSIPLESIIRYIEKENPDILMLSITLPDHINKINRLLKTINEIKPSLKIVIGGQSSHLLNLNMNQHNNILIKSNITFNEFTIMMKNICRNNSKNKKSS
ncbi:MAG: cobalamin B12-binding domain-containing protein [Nitrososphaeraceae archaeon]